LLLTRFASFDLGVNRIKAYAPDGFVGPQAVGEKGLGVFPQILVDATEL
jgi:hypothetical protein